MTAICELCKSSDNLEKEEGLLICTICGLVVEEDDFQDDFDGDLKESKNAVKNHNNNICNLDRLTNFMKAELGDPNFKTDTRRQARDMLDYCFDQFKFTDCMKEDARYSFIQLLNSRSFYFATLKTKILLAGVAVYLTMNKFDCLVTKNMISKSIGCTVFEFGEIYKRALNSTKVEKPRFFKIEEQVAGAINSLAFEKSEIPELINTVVELIRFQERCCPIESLSAMNLIYATTFHAWKSIKVEERINVSMKDFKKQFNLKANLDILSRKLKNFLIELCESVPWILNKKKLRNTVYYHIKYLLENSNSILDNYMRIKNKKIDDLNKDRASNEVSHEVSNEVNNEINNEVSHKFSVKRERYVDDDDWYDGISDSEIESYIRTNEEVRILKRIKSKLNRN